MLWEIFEGRVVPVSSSRPSIRVLDGPNLLRVNLSLKITKMPPNNPNRSRPSKTRMDGPDEPTGTTWPCHLVSTQHWIKLSYQSVFFITVFSPCKLRAGDCASHFVTPLLILLFETHISSDLASHGPNECACFFFICQQEVIYNYIGQRFPLPFILWKMDGN